MTILVTGSNGFIAKNLLAHLRVNTEYIVLTADRTTSAEQWAEYADKADVVVHLAGENRPSDESAFKKVNTDLTAMLVDLLEKSGNTYKLLYASSAQATQDNPYGRSKKAAEELIEKNVKNGEAVLYRFPGVFGKWCRPNYNSVVATFCYNVANELPIEVRDENYSFNLVYVDDLVARLLKDINGTITAGKISFAEVQPVFSTTLGSLANTIKGFRESRNTYFLPEVGDALTKDLYSTYLTYLPKSDFAYEPILRTDERGSLFELLKSPAAGQIFLSTTKPGITRGNHFHHTKTEKFCVVSGTGLIQFRKIDGTEVIEYEVNGTSPKVVDIPPGYTHNIKNTGETELITLFWANEIFDQQRPDTYFEKV